MSNDFQFKPLSSGIGIGSLSSKKTDARNRGSLTAPVSTSHSTSDSSLTSTIAQASERKSSLYELPEVPIGLESVKTSPVAPQQAGRQAYESEYRKTRQRSVSRLTLFVLRSFDLVIVLLLAVIASIVFGYFGLLVWRLGLGESHPANPIAILETAYGLLNHFGVVAVAGLYSLCVGVVVFFRALLRH